MLSTTANSRLVWALPPIRLNPSSVGVNTPAESAESAARPLPPGVRVLPVSRGVAAEVRGAAGVRGTAVDLDVDRAGALAPDRDAVAETAAFQIEGDVVLPGKLFDQRPRAA